MNKQDKISNKISRIIEAKRDAGYSGGLQINFTNGYISNKLKYHISDEILTVDELQENLDENLL